MSAEEATRQEVRMVAIVAAILYAGTTAKYGTPLQRDEPDIVATARRLTSMCGALGYFVEPMEGRTLPDVR